MRHNLTLVLVFIFLFSCGVEDSLRDEAHERKPDRDRIEKALEEPNISSEDATGVQPVDEPQKEAKNPIEDFPSLATREVYEFYSTIDDDHDYLFEPTRRDLGSFRVFAEAGNPGTIPLFRCYSRSGANHFVSVFENCESTNDHNYENLGTYGYIYQDGSKGLPLKRCYQPDIFDHSIADENGDCPQGYGISEVLGSFPALED